MHLCNAAREGMEGMEGMEASSRKFEVRTRAFIQSCNLPGIRLVCTVLAYWVVYLVCFHCKFAVSVVLALFRVSVARWYISSTLHPSKYQLVLTCGKPTDA